MESGQKEVCRWAEVWVSSVVCPAAFLCVPVRLALRIEGQVLACVSLVAPQPPKGRIHPYPISRAIGSEKPFAMNQTGQPGHVPKSRVGIAKSNSLSSSSPNMLKLPTRDQSSEPTAVPWASQQSQGPAPSECCASHRNSGVDRSWAPVRAGTGGETFRLVCEIK
jgi:hypothetical protein